ncbi:MAG TPA: acyloxyacyl hydrolase [Allosphingosinicella sp.]
MKTHPFLAGILVLASAASPLQAQEIFGGVYSHDVKTGITRSGFEDGIDLQIGWRGERVRALRAIGAPSPHVFASLNSAGDTHFAAAGISWKIGRSVYVRPGVGLAVHNGPGRFQPGRERIYFGSRVLFEPEIGIGAQLTDRISVEASWVHLSHATLFSDQNPGIDNIGMRLNYRFR